MIGSLSAKRMLAVMSAVFGLAACSSVTYLKEAPAPGSIRFGKVVYVDDGKCPDGQVTQITGGSQTQSIPRQEVCVKRPR